MLDAYSLKQCDIQGRLFELAVRNNLDSETFAKAFMKSQVAKGLDSDYSRMHWAGEGYLLEELLDTDKSIKQGGVVYSEDSMYWIGYIYRYWHFLRGTDSKSIYRMAPMGVMAANYLMFHTFAPELAIENLIEIHEREKSSL